MSPISRGLGWHVEKSEFLITQTRKHVLKENQASTYQNHSREGKKAVSLATEVRS